MNSYDKEMLVAFFYLALGLVAALLLLVFTNEQFNRYKCNNYEEITGVPTQYVTLDTCYVRATRGWQRWDEYKARALTNEE